MRETQRCKLLRFAGLLSLACTLQSANAADNEALKLRVLAEYPRALDELEAAYSNIQAQAHHQARLEIGQPRQSELSWTIRFARSGESLLIVNDLEAAEAGQDADAPTSTGSAQPPAEVVKKTRKPQDTVMCVTPTHAFRLTRPDHSSPYIIAYVGSDLKAIINDLTPRFRKSLGCAFNANSIRLSTFVRLKGFVLDRVIEETEPSGRKLLKLHFTFTSQEPKNPNGPVIATVKEGTLVVSPEEKWALQSYELKYIQPYGFYNYVGRIEYDPRPSPVPIPQKIVARTINEMTPGASYDPKRTPPGARFEDVYNFTKVTLGPVRDDEFELTAFSLPDVTRPGVQSRPRSATSTLLIALAIAGFAAVISIRWYLKRTSNR